MPIVLVRVDDRLVHGQVLEGWAPFIRAQEIVIASDELASDPLQQMIVQALVPNTLDLVVDTVENVAALLIEPESRVIRRLVLVERPSDALRLKRAGAPFSLLNLGNFSSKQVRVCLNRNVGVGDEGIRALREIVMEGVEVNIQSVPFEKALNWEEVNRRLSEV